MKTNVKKTTNGNYVIVIEGVLMFADISGNFQKATHGTFDQIPVKSVAIEYSSIEEIPNNYEKVISEIAAENQRELQDFENSTEVKRMDFNGNKIQLRSNAKLYLYSFGWNRYPMNELTHRAIECRLAHNEPLDLSKFDDDFKPLYEEMFNKVISLKNSETERIEKENAEYENLIYNQPIEATVENISILLKNLNKQNWGSWKLPSLTIGYKANQYDCEGKTATTITLDKPISDEDGFIANERKFVYGAPRGHLTKYQPLR